MQQSQMFNMPKKRVFGVIHHQFLKFALETQIKAYAVVAKVSTCRKNAFLHCFHDLFSKTALETQIMAYAAVANVQHAEKRVFALFSSSILENSSRYANKGICRSRKCSTRRKKAFLHCFHHQFLKAA